MAHVTRENDHYHTMEVKSGYSWGESWYMCSDFFQREEQL